MFTSKFFLCFGYVRHQGFKLSLMTDHIIVQTVHKKVKGVHKFSLAYFHNVQHASAEDHQLDQVKFSYRFT